MNLVPNVINICWMGATLNNTKETIQEKCPHECTQCGWTFSPKNNSEPHLIAHQCFNQNHVHLVEYTMVDLNVVKTLKRNNNIATLNYT